MTMQESPVQELSRGATAVITHRVSDHKHVEYEKWLEDIGPICQQAIGHLDIHVVRPIAERTQTYTIIIRFDTKDHLEIWMASTARTDMIDRVKPFLLTGDDFYISSGLDFWFMPEQTKAPIPKRWKQYLVTLSAIYPLVLTIPMFLIPLLRNAGLPQNRMTDTFIVAMCLVFLMVYIIMPRYTKLIRHWFFK